MKDNEYSDFVDLMEKLSLNFKGEIDEKKMIYILTNLNIINYPRYQEQ